MQLVDNLQEIQSRIITTETCQMILDIYGVVHIKGYPDIIETLDQAKKSLAALIEITDGKGAPVLLDLREIRGKTREVRDFYAQPEATQYYHAVAYIVGTPFQKMLGDISLMISKLTMRTPTKLFLNEQEAALWLRTQVRP
jgi:hypothetical protein